MQSSLTPSTSLLCSFCFTLSAFLALFASVYDVKALKKVQKEPLVARLVKILCYGKAQPKTKTKFFGYLCNILKKERRKWTPGKENYLPRIGIEYSQI